MVSLCDVFLKKMPKLLTYVCFYDILIIPLRILFFRTEGGTKTGPKSLWITRVCRGLFPRRIFRIFKMHRASVFKFNRSLFMYFHNKLQFLSGGAESMASDVRIKVTLACTECKQRNYDTTKNKRNDPDRLELRKYCKFCRKHTVHKETKWS